jgi:plastocyanin
VKEFASLVLLDGRVWRGIGLAHHWHQGRGQMNYAKSVARVVSASTALTILLAAACSRQTPTSPSTPPPPPEAPTANAYILPGAVDLGATAFGDEPVVIHKGERLRWRNADGVEHNVVADTPVAEFLTTGVLAPGGERSFTMNSIGATRIHCSIHPQMQGTLVVRQP